MVSNRKVIVPQLGATGVLFREIKERSGFRVDIGPIKPVFADNGIPDNCPAHATGSVRQVLSAKAGFPGRGLPEIADSLMVGQIQVDRGDRDKAVLKRVHIGIPACFNQWEPPPIQ